MTKSGSIYVKPRPELLSAHIVEYISSAEMVLFWQSVTSNYPEGSYVAAAPGRAPILVVGL